MNRAAHRTFVDILTKKKTTTRRRRRRAMPGRKHKDLGQLLHRLVGAWHAAAERLMSADTNAAWDGEDAADERLEAEIEKLIQHSMEQILSSERAAATPRLVDTLRHLMQYHRVASAKPLPEDHQKVESDWQFDPGVDAGPLRAVKVQKLVSVVVAHQLRNKQLLAESDSAECRAEAQRIDIELHEQGLVTKLEQATFDDDAVCRQTACFRPSAGGEATVSTECIKLQKTLFVPHGWVPVVQWAVEFNSFLHLTRELFTRRDLATPEAVGRRCTLFVAMHVYLLTLFEDDADAL